VWVRLNSSFSKMVLKHIIVRFVRTYHDTWYQVIIGLSLNIYYCEWRCLVLGVQGYIGDSTLIRNMIKL